MEPFEIQGSQSGFRQNSERTPSGCWKSFLKLITVAVKQSKINFALSCFCNSNQRSSSI